MTTEDTPDIPVPIVRVEYQIISHTCTDCDRPAFVVRIDLDLKGSLKLRPYCGRHSDQSMDKLSDDFVEEEKGIYTNPNAMEQAETMLREVLDEVAQEDEEPCPG